MKLPLRLGLALLGRLVIGSGAFIGRRYYLSPRTSERVIVKGKGDAKSTAAAVTAKTPTPALASSTPPRSCAMCGTSRSERYRTLACSPSPSFLLT